MQRWLVLGSENLLHHRQSVKAQAPRCHLPTEPNLLLLHRKHQAGKLRRLIVLFVHYRSCFCAAGSSLFLNWHEIIFITMEEQWLVPHERHELKSTEKWRQKEERYKGEQLCEWRRKNLSNFLLITLTEIFKKKYSIKAISPPQEPQNLAVAFYLQQNFN